MVRRSLLFPVVLALVVAACTDDSTETEAAAETIVTTSTTQPTTTTAVATTVQMMEPFNAVFEVIYVEGEGCTWSGPSKIPTGEHTFVLHDPTGELEALYIIRADEDRTLQDAVDDQPAPGKWHAKPDWHHYTVDLGSGKETDDGTVFAKLLKTPGPHLVLASLYDGVETPEDRIHWFCSPSFTVVKSTE